MRRALIFALEVGWLAAWAVRLGVGDVAWLMAAAGLGAGLARRRGPVAMVVWLAVLVAGGLLGGVWGVGLVLVALWRGASPFDPEHPAVFERLGIAVVGGAALAVNQHAYLWVLPAVLVLGLATALATSHEPGMDARVHVRLAGMLAAAGLLAGLVVLGLAAWAPWQYLAGPVRAVLFLIGHLLPSFAHGLPPHHQAPPHVAKRPPQPKRPRPRTTASLLPLLIVGGILALGFVYYAVRFLSRLGWPTWEESHSGDEALVVEHLEAGRRERVTLTRRVVQQHMRGLAHRRRGPEPAETVREWLARLYGSASPANLAQLSRLYEEVRYGGQMDDALRAAAARRLWPEAPPTSPAEPGVPRSGSQ